ncbi:HET-domain-containing protein [Glonium stellatum]|uniref:HET-domain-containing protein n=1 Tax=Glonium stellatum TaxID=574774 RepID=A0A8E2FE17_9PEZI|nr:HET-domain-containing protein [Glonium stellatum]
METTQSPSDASLIESIIHLCPVCATFDFAHLFSAPFFPRQRDYERTGGARFLMGTIAEISTRPACPLCRLVRRGITRYYPSAPLTEKIYLGIGLEAVHRCNSAEHDDSDLQYRRVEFLEAVSDQGDPWEIGRGQTRLKQASVRFRIYQMHRAGKSGPPRHILARNLLPHVDVKLLKQWIKRCEGQHEKWHVVQAPTSVRFIALSYVWGSQNTVRGAYRSSRKNLKTKKAEDGTETVFLELPKELPQVIEETIQLVRDIEEKYVWIDAICILHDDPEHLKAHINAMDAVYANSLVTVIAASGFSFPSHLPGASDTPRPLLPIKETVIGCELSLRLPPIHGLVNGIEASPWSKRAWTYQEGLISRRRLVFTDQEVFFICVEEVYAESCTEPPNGTSRLILYNSTPADRLQAIFNNPNLERVAWQFDKYSSLVKEFLSRDITYISDGLNAFKGLERRIQATSHAEFFWGLPECEFHKALLWQVPDPQTSSPLRPNFPSWSWGGWFKAPYYVDTPNLVDMRPLEEPRHIRSLGVRFWKEHEDGTLAEVDLETRPLEMWRKTTPININYKKHMFVDTWIASFRVDASQKSADPQFVCNGIDYGPVPLRRISASDIRFKLHGKSWDVIVLSKMMPKWTSYDEEDFYRRLHAGEIDFNNDPIFASGDPLGLHEPWSIFNAMILEWTGDIARCIAICEIRKRVWEAVNPQKRRVKLA